MAVSKRVAILPRYLALVKSCLGSIVRRMEYHNGESSVGGTQACQGGGVCDTDWENHVSPCWGRDEESKEQILLVFTTA